MFVIASVVFNAGCVTVLFFQCKAQNFLHVGLLEKICIRNVPLNELQSKRVGITK